MKIVLTLIMLQLKARVSLPKYKSAKQYIKKAIFIATMLGILGAFIAIYYLLAINFADPHNRDADLSRPFLIFTLLGFMIIQTLFMIPNFIKRLDINNDRELLLKLPVSPQQIYASKMVVSYVLEVIFACVVLLPILIAHGIALEMHLGFYAYIPFLLLVVPAVPFFIVSLLLYPLMKIVNYMRNRPLFTSVVYLSLLLIGIIIYMTIIEATMQQFLFADNFAALLADNVQSIRRAGRFFPLQGLYANVIGTTWYTALWSFNLIFLLTAILLFASYKIAAFAFNKTYLEERASFSTIHKKHEFKPSRPLFATLKKDSVNISRSSNYTFQLLLLVVITPLLVFFVSRIAMLSTYQSLSMELRGGGASDISGADVAMDMVFGICVFIVMILMPLACSFAASNITREGPNIYHTKIIPQSFRNQLFIKSIIVFVPVFISICISVALLRIPYQPPTGVAFYQYIAGWDSLYLLTVASTMAIGYITLGTYLDLRNPLCNQLGSSELYKSTSHTNTIMGVGVLIGAIVGVLSMLGGYTELLESFGDGIILTLARAGQSMHTALLIFAPTFAVVGCALLFIDGPRRYWRLEQ